MLLWSTGFIAAKYGLAYAPPLKFLLYRFVLVAALMGAVALAMRATWPATLAEAGHVVVPAWLVHGVYLGGVLVAIASGMSAGMAAMLVGLQPILTVVLARVWLGERVVPRQWLGLALGLAGRLARGAAQGGADRRLQGARGHPARARRHQRRHALPEATLLACRPAHRRVHPVRRLRASSTRRSSSCSSRNPCASTPEFVFALGWAVVVLSVGAISLLYWLLRHGAASNVAGLFFLVPAVTAVMAWVLFGETLDAIAIAGMVLISVGVALARQMREVVSP